MGMFRRNIDYKEEKKKKKNQYTIYTERVVGLIPYWPAKLTITHKCILGECFSKWVIIYLKPRFQDEINSNMIDSVVKMELES